MTVRKLNTGQWICDIRPNGVDGKRIRKKFVTRGEAIAYENFVIAETQNKPWLGDKEDPRRLNDLIQLWFNSHGSTLGDGETRLSAMYYISECLGNPKAVNFTAKDFASYREKRLSGELYRTERIKKVAPRSLNLELAYLNAMFNELIRLGEWTLTNPVKNIRAFRLDESEMAFLEQDQITTLLNECKNSTNPDTLIVALICISTGARWSEAEKLTNSAISQFRITYTKTKGKRNRTVPISKE